MKKKTQKTAAERTASAFSAIGPLVGLGSTIASAVPSLKTPQKSNVRVSNFPTVQAAMGVAAQGYGVNRGGMALQGMRAGGQAGNLVASQQLAAQSQNEITNINQTNARNERVAGFGRDTAAGVADLGVGLLDAANARKTERMGQGGSFLPGDQPRPDRCLSTGVHSVRAFKRFYVTARPLTGLRASAACRHATKP